MYCFFVANLNMVILMWTLILMCAKNFIQAIWLKIQNVSKHYRNRPHLEILYTGVSGLFDNGLEHFPCALMLMDT